MNLFEEARKNYPQYLERAYIYALLLVIVLIHISSHIAITPGSHEPPQIAMTVENIPQTHQGKKRTPPPRPPIPIPSDDEDVDDDETIEPIDLKYFSEGTEDGGGGDDRFGIGADNVIAPRPLAWVVPEYPDVDRSKGIRGLVKMSLEIDEKGNVLSVTVLDNQTGSKECEKAAINAAKASRFIPAKQDGKPVKFWFIHEIYFNLSDD
ncbi:MAG: energy transducer TonB [Deferribacteres bacterium]|nr:energy transducer TonB [candidate division KSB1 bacterium]MCB9500754.1 energy transducer TonB [Deferribacteres bacterium]